MEIATGTGQRAIRLLLRIAAVAVVVCGLSWVFMQFNLTWRVAMGIVIVMISFMGIIAYLAGSGDSRHGSMR